MEKDNRKLYSFGSSLILINIFVKFFLLVALLIVIFYDRRYSLGIVMIIAFALMSGFELFLIRLLRGPINTLSYAGKLGISIYLFLFSLCLPGILTAIPLLKRYKKNP
ncbi:MAG TPA: hypothetical protein VJZ48_00405 [Bacilli bacterium]|nr:hypothetical protein [Bacilli bacterium]